MTTYSSAIKALDASRRVESELDVGKHQYNLQKSKLERELEGLSRSRRNFVENALNQAHDQYARGLRKDEEISQDHINRKKRATAQRAKVAQQDFDLARERLVNERNQYDDLDKQSRAVDRLILDLKNRSKYAAQDEDRQVAQLNKRKRAILLLLQESRQRQLYHFEQSKKLSLVQ